MTNNNHQYDPTDYEFLKRIRTKVLKYDIIREIFYLIIFPLLKHKPHRISADAWLEGCWAPESYPIKTFVATKPLKVPGAIWMEDGRRMRGYGYRGINRGTKLWARFDRKTKTVDVETLIRATNTYHTFTLTAQEWKELNKKIKEA